MLPHLFRVLWWQTIGTPQAAQLRKWNLLRRFRIQRIGSMLMARVCYVVDWLNDDVLPSMPAKRIARPTFRPQLEGLTERVLLNATTWTGAVSQDWMTAGNWSNGVPGANDDATITNQGAKGGPIISANEKAQVSSITDNGGLPLIIQSQGSLEVTDNSGGQGSLWNADLTVNGVLEADNPNSTGNVFKWIGGNIHGTQTGTNPWGIYISDGATWDVWQTAQNLGVTMYVGMDQVNGGTVQKVNSYLNVSDTAAANQMRQNLSLNNNANLEIEDAGRMYLLQASNSASAGGIVVDMPATSSSTITDQGYVFHDGDTGGQSLTIQPTVVIDDGIWNETGKNGPSGISFISQVQGQQGAYAVTISNTLGQMVLHNGVTVNVSKGIWLQQGGLLVVQTAKNVPMSQATVNGNIYDGNGGSLNIGDSANPGSYAALSVNGNVDIESGSLTAWVGFDQNGNLSNFSRLNVFGQFAVDALDLQNSTMWVNSVLTNNVQPVAGQIVNLVTATTTKTAKKAPTQAFDNIFYGGGYRFVSALLTSSGYQLST